MSAKPQIKPTPIVPTPVKPPVGLGASTGVSSKEVNLTEADVPLGLVNDGRPMLLLPVRIETRFADLPSGPQLWVRIYPDQIAIDSHDPSLTADEWTLAHAYWQAMSPLLPGDTAGQQAAWAALAAAFGPQRAAYVAVATAPDGFETWLAAAGTSTAAASTPLGTALTILTSPPGALRDASWNQPARARALPTIWFVALTSGTDTEVVQVMRPAEDLVVSPDPGATGALGDPDGPTAAMDWLTDFVKAQQVGMGVAIKITPAQRAGGFDRIALFGYSGVGGPFGQDLFEQLLTSHRFTDGLAFVPQGTPTKNSTDSTAGYSRKDPTFSISFANERSGPLISESLVTATEWASGATADGRAFAAALGINPATISHCMDAAGADQRDAVAMATALWPATGDYYVRHLFGVNLTAALRESIREYATLVVRARGPIPAIQIGNIPYGILPISKVADEVRDSDVDGTSVLDGVAALVQRARGIWEATVTNFPLQVTPSSSVSPEQALANVLGRDASTVTVNARLDIGPWTAWNLGQWDVMAGIQDVAAGTGTFSLPGWTFTYTISPQDVAAGDSLIATGNAFLEAVVNAQKLSVTEATGLGWSAPTGPLSGFLFLQALGSNLRHVTADGQVSETQKLPTNHHITKVFNTGGTHHATVPANVLEYFAAETASGLLAYSPNKADLTVLAALVHQALLLEYASVAGQILNTPLAEPEWRTVPGAGDVGTFLWALNHTTYTPPEGLPAASGKLGDYLHAQMQTPAGKAAFPSLAALLDAVAHLAEMPTAALDRTLLETLDVCAYRLDAWATSVATGALATARETTPQGLGLGIWGYVENLRPAAAQALSAQDAATLALVADVGPVVADPPIGPRKDATGFIFAPSLAQAATGAILRNGYLAHSAGTFGAPFAIDLSSKRVRTALYLMEGIRQGQHLGALLGDQFEQGINDAGLQIYLQPFRKLYPIVANKIAQQAGTSTDAVAASNVVDGAALQRAWVSGLIPWGAGGLSAATEGTIDYTTLTGLLNELNAAVDALSDIGVAESVYQVAMGNPARAGGALNASSREQHPPQPAVVEGPRSGLDFTQRVLSTFAVNPLAPPPSAWLGAATPTPRALAEPWLEQWLTAVLPAPGDVQFQVTYTPAAGGSSITSGPLSLADASLSALDLMALAPPPPTGAAAGALDGSELAGSDLERWILAQYIAAGQLPPEIQKVTGIYNRAALPAVPITLPEILVLVRALQELVRAARPVTPGDFIGPTSLAPSADLDLSGPAERLSQALANLSNLSSAFATLLGSIPGGSAPSAADGDSLSALLLTAAGYGFPGAAPVTTARDETSLAALQAQATAVAAKVAKRVADVLADTSIASGGQLLIVAPSLTLKIAQKAAMAQNTAQAIFGAAFVVLHVITPGPAAIDPVAQAVSNLTAGIEAWQAAGATGANVAAAGVLQQLTHLRPPVTRLDEVVALSAALTNSPVADLAVAQLGGQVPYSATNPWLGQGPVATQFPWTVDVAGTQESLRGTYTLMVWTPLALGASTGASMCGLFFDEWIEQIPNNVERTAVAFHYAEPTARAPQSFLLAILPDRVENWTASALYSFVLEATCLARMRTVDPQTLELGGKVGQLLPALFQGYGQATISSFIPILPTSTDEIGS